MGFINIPRLIQITLLRELGQIVAKYSAASGTTLNRKMSAISINALSNTVYKNVNNNITATVSATNLPTNPLLSPRSKTTTSANELVIGPKTKIFEWNVLNGKAKVCMLYETLGSNNPKFYLIDLSDYKFILLADTFTEYLRMAIVHLGLPYWELLFSSITLPAWVEVCIQQISLAIRIILQIRINCFVAFHLIVATLFVGGTSSNRRSSCASFEIN